MNFKIIYHKYFGEMLLDSIKKLIEKNISEYNSKLKPLIFMEFYKFYCIFMDELDKQQIISNRDREKSQTSKNKINENIKKIKKGITNKKKEVDKILLELSNKNKILPALLKKSTDTNKLIKNLANNKDLEYYMKQLEQSSKNENFFQPSELNILRQKKRNSQITNNENIRLQLLEQSYNNSELHLFSFKTPILQSKKIRKKCKINSRNFTYDGLTFSSSFWIFEEVKDEIWKHNGRSCLSIQDCVNFIMFIDEFASLVLNTVFLFSQLTQLEHFNRRNTLFPSLSL